MKYKKYTKEKLLAEHFGSHFSQKGHFSFIYVLDFLYEMKMDSQARVLLEITFKKTGGLWTVSTALANSPNWLVTKLIFLNLQLCLPNNSLFYNQLLYRLWQDNNSASTAVGKHEIKCDLANVVRGLFQEKVWTFS